MSDTYNEELLPITWESWDDVDYFAIQFYGVEFTEDFGPMKKGDRINTLYLDYESGVMQAFSEDNTVIKTLKVKIVFDRELDNSEEE